MRFPNKPPLIRTRVLLGVLAVGLLPIVLIFASSELLLRKRMMLNEYDKIEQMTRRVAVEVSHWMGHTESGLRILADNAVLASPQSTEIQRLREMKLIHQYSALLSDVTLYDTNGHVQVSTTYGYWESVERTAWFQRAVGGEFAVSPPACILGVTGLYVTAYAPVRGAGGAVESVLTARIPFDPIAKVVSEGRIGETGFMVLVDAHNNVLAHPRPDRVLTKFDERLPADFFVRNRMGEYTGRRGNMYLYAVEPIGPALTRVGQWWFVIGMKPRQDALRLMSDEQGLLVGSAVFTLAAVYLVGVFLSRRLSHPIVEAARAAQKVARGDLDIVVPGSGPREVRMLADAFNRMVREVRYHKGRLENLVEQRTEKLRESQQQLEQLMAHLRAAYESMMDGMVMLEWPSGRVIAVNQRFGDMFGLDPAALVDRTCDQLNASLKPLFAEPQGGMFRWDYYAQRAEEVTFEEWEIARPRHRTFSVYSAPAKGSQGVVFARLWTFRDLTQQRQLEDELRQAQKMEAVGRLAGGIAHDFNNLLTGILGNLSMAEMELTPKGDPAPFIQSAKQAARRATDLVTQLLGFSRRSRLELRPCDPNQTVRDVYELLRHSVDPHVEIRLEMQQALWAVSADATQLQQVLMNLCVNGVDAMPSGGRLTVTTRNVRVEKEDAKQWLDAKPGEYVRVSVEDAGQGMTAEVQSHLFEPFFTTKAPGKGTGLGLAMSYGIIKQHGGWITCYSELNRGTTFGVYIPRCIAAQETRAAETVEVPARGGNERVLIVDDEAVIRQVIQSILHRYGYRCVMAANGEEALQIVEQEKGAIDLVLLDLTMPRLSGRDTLRKIQEIAPALRVIISSGYPVDLATFQSETGLKPDGFVQKPYEAGSLARTLREVLDGTPSSSGQPA